MDREGKPILSQNPFDDRQLAGRYEQWYVGPGLYADRCEKSLLGKLLADFPDCTTLLDVGCGTGHFTRWFAERGLAATGLDLSGVMLAEAIARNRQAYVLGDASRLPFQCRAFHLVSMITTLEFLPDASRALAEVVRVAQHGILLGVLNRWSLHAVRRRRSEDPIWSAAHFFSPPELIHLVRQAAGTQLEDLRWGTTQWPVPFVGSLHVPFGGFIGLAARLGRQP